MRTEFWTENLKGRGLPNDLGVDGNILERILKELFGKVWTACIWLRIGTSDGLL
jgi:hypothetical protein